MQWASLMIMHVPETNILHLFCEQEHPGLRSATLRSQPFQLRRTVEEPGSYPVTIELKLVEGLDKSTVSLQYTAEILSQESFNEQVTNDNPGGKRKRRGKSVEQTTIATFVTQEVHYDSIGAI